MWHGVVSMNEESILHLEIGPKLENETRALTLRRSGAELAEEDDVSDAREASLDTLSRLLSERNIALLRLIKTAKPKSVAELARLSGRPKASLTLTLRRFENFGVIAFREIGGRRKVPTVVCNRLMLDLKIDPPARA